MAQQGRCAGNGEAHPSATGGPRRSDQVGTPSEKERPSNPVTETRVLIVDDEDDMRVLLRNMITLANDGLAVADEAADGEEGILRWREHRPDVVLLDQRMPGPTGLDIAARILAEDPDQTVVLFTAFLEPALAAPAQGLGVPACISQRDAPPGVAPPRAPPPRGPV